MRAPVVIHPPHGTVQLIEGAADDLMVANAARVSLANRSEWDEAVTTTQDGTELRKVLKLGDAGLVSFLMKNKHGTPFEHNLMTFLVKAPIFVFREWHRHRIGVSINEMSGRYTELRPEFYTPSEFRTQTGKPGHYKFDPITDEWLREKGFKLDDMTDLTVDLMMEDLEQEYGRCYTAYERYLSWGWAKEQARLILPVGIYSEMYWTCNARSLMAFLSLRNAPTAQREIKDYAEVMEGMFAELMPVTAQAFIDNGRIAP